VQNNIAIMTIWPTSKPEVEFQYVVRYFYKPEVVISQQCTELTRQNLVYW